jgi:hypothetical protein
MCNSENFKNCSHFNECSINVCPLDKDIEFRKNLPNEKRCPYTINRKSTDEKGIRTQLPDRMFNSIPVKNLKTLNIANQERWTDLHK